MGYLAIPIGVVASGYLKNYLLRRACRKRDLIRTESRTRRAIAAFGALAAALGVVLWFVPITNIWVLFAAIGGFAIVYLPTAYLLDKKI